ncbi:hypothetical protein ACFYU9_26340 [Streptomyces sp. NPDC004327]|uniref:hypothetical protein n=1 Tax=unclassified Streptomyces TaxID=2593676 RepID=UPI0036940A35
MTTLYTAPSAYGRHRQSEPRFEESVQQTAPAPVPTPLPLPAQAAPAPVSPPAPHPSDPPIYSAVLQLWASRGRTLPGHQDQEWSRLAAGPVWADRTVRVSGILVRQGDAR